MAAEKKWNFLTFSSTPKFLGNNQTYTITCAGQNSFINLNDASIILDLNMALGTTGATYTISKPAVAWVNQIQTIIKFQTPRGQEIKNYSGYLNRGIAAFALEVMEYSAAKYDMLDQCEFLTTPRTGGTNTRIHALIPLKFLCDPAYDAGLLNIDSITFLIGWESQDKIFTPSAGTLDVSGTVGFKFYTIETTTSEIIPPHVREIPNRQIYIDNKDLPAGSGSVSSYVTAAFPVSELFYFFLSKTGFDLNAIDEAVVTNHQVSSMGAVYPPQSTYGASFTGGRTGGILRHYDELISIIGKQNPEFNNKISIQSWGTSYRIYAIEIGTEQRVGQAFNFQATFSEPTGAACTCVMLFVGRGHI